jgi:predicted  nucleic acid-binding Zn-ribbon protein
MSEYVEAIKRNFLELTETAKALQQAVWNTEQQIVKLEIENRSLREALKQARWQLRNQGYTMREIALGIGITAAQLSAWTDEIPNREPDFKD